jgi:TPP-dependent pyruvate/acetoin dehydrogenase alpha subunit
MGTALHRHQAEPDLAPKAAAYGIAFQTTDGMDVAAVEEAAGAAAAAVRAGRGPVLLEARTYRFRAHSMYDPERYRSKDEVERWKQRDPIALQLQHLREHGAIDDAALAALEGEVSAEIDAAVAAADAAPWEPAADLTRDVYTPRGDARCA